LKRCPRRGLGATIEGRIGLAGFFADDILAYWVGPGLAEIHLHDELRAAGGLMVVFVPERRRRRRRSLHTNWVSMSKSYSCPRLLGETLSERLGGLADVLTNANVAIPDAMVNRRPHYLDDLRQALQGNHARNVREGERTVNGIGNRMRRCARQFRPGRYVPNGWPASCTTSLGLETLSGASALLSGYRSITRHQALRNAKGGIAEPSLTRRQHRV